MAAPEPAEPAVEGSLFPVGRRFSIVGRSPAGPAARAAPPRSSTARAGLAAWGPFSRMAAPFRTAETSRGARAVSAALMADRPAPVATKSILSAGGSLHNVAERLDRRRCRRLRRRRGGRDGDQRRDDRGLVDAVRLSSTSDALIVQRGARFIGALVGGGGELELAQPAFRHPGAGRLLAGRSRLAARGFEGRLQEARPA